jgi:hypothetical protein
VLNPRNHHGAPSQREISPLGGLISRKQPPLVRLGDISPVVFAGHEQNRAADPLDRDLGSAERGRIFEHGGERGAQHSRAGQGMPM